MHTSLHIDLEDIGGKVVLRLDGRLDAATAPILERKIDSLIAVSMIDFIWTFYAWST